METNQQSASILKTYLHKYRRQYLMGLIALIVVDLIQLRIPIITKEIIDGLKTGHFTLNDVKGKAILLLIIGVAITVGRYIWRHFIFGTGRKIEYDLRNRFFAHLEILSTNYYNEHQTGDLMAHATNDLNAVRMMVGPGILMGFDAVILTGLVVIQMVAVTGIKLTVVAILPLLLLAVGSLYFGRFVHIRSREKQEAFSKMTEQVQENLSGIRVIKAFVQEKKEIQAFRAINHENFFRNMRLIRINAWMTPLANLIAGISIALVLGYGGYLTVLGEITLGDFVAYINYLYMLVWPMMAFGMCINTLSQGSASVNRIEEVLNQRPDVKDNTDVIKAPKLQGTIRIKDLTFSYPHTNDHALEGINLTVEQGETIGIIGRTGSGKTTLMNLILRLYNVPRDTLIIDGIDINRWPLQDLRSQIGYVTQDNFLFSDTITKNIAFGAPEAEMKGVVDAAKISNVHENIVDFPDQYETIVGERGVTLSGGQKQRISIARAIIKEPSLLILDDAVSAVDTQTEEYILKHLKENRKGKTTFIIAHRISTLAGVDRIIVLEEGRIVEEGTHKDLMASQGTYYHMVHRQQLEQAISEEA